MSIVHVVSVSGGKDSLATLLIAIKRFGLASIKAIFCDTGNEHPAVYEYLDYLEVALGLKIHRLKADFSEQIAAKRMFIARDQRTRRDKKTGRKVRWTNKAKRRALEILKPTGNPFLDLCLWKGRFRSRKAQFCTEQLKRDPAVMFQLALVDAGHTVASWQGVRRDESANRRNAKKFETIGPRMYAFRPIVEWTAAQVFELAERHGIKPNPLYLQGMGRVGCMPCINVNKAELNQIARRFPEEIARIREWELLVARASKRQGATYIPAPGIEVHEAPDHGIYSVVEWSKTARGGKQIDLLADSADYSACSSAYGLCEQPDLEAA